MADEFPPEYHVQMCGDEWFTTDGEEAEEIRLWDYDTVLAVVEYDDHGEPNVQGTYTITEHNGNLRECTEKELQGWRSWQAALEFASGTKREEWQ